MCSIFIDFKSAYNTVNRDILFSYMDEKKILDTDELRFLMYLHNTVYFDLGTRKVQLEKGVHQGSPLSPALFDIYMELFMSKMKNQYPDLWYLLYADDLVMIIQHTDITGVIDLLYETSRTFNLIISPTKSAILQIRDHAKLLETPAERLHNIPIAQEYCYLGITINHHGSISPHLKKIKQRCTYLQGSLQKINRNLSFENQNLIFMLYLRPYFTYVSPIIQT